MPKSLLAYLLVASLAVLAIANTKNFDVKHNLNFQDLKVSQKADCNNLKTPTFQAQDVTTSSLSLEKIYVERIIPTTGVLTVSEIVASAA